MISLCGEIIRKDNIEQHCSKPDYWMSTEFDERILDYWKKPNGECMVKLQQVEGFECETGLKNTMPAHLGKFFLINSEKITTISKCETGGF